MPQDCLALATLTGSRICHDLASPLGSVANGLELLDLSGMKDSPELTLIRDSIQGAKATLELMRLAFGRAGLAENLSSDGLHDTLRGYYQSRPRLRVDWSAEGEISRAWAQILLLTILAAEQALPRGGRLSIRQDAHCWKITAAGESLSPDMAFWSAVQGQVPLPSLDPRTVHFVTLKECLDRHGSSISITSDETGFCVTL